MKWLRYGPGAWLLRFADAIGDDAFFRCRSIVSELTRRPPAGLIEFVPGFTTILLEFDPQQADVERSILPELTNRLNFAMLAKISTAPIKEIEVHYDGPDLERVAELNQLTTSDVVELHTAPIYRVYLLGFSPGFPYLGDLDRLLHTPRLRSPRPKVPAGAVAIGGEHTGIYTIESPGGWNIIGHTSVKIFDPARGQSANTPEDTFLLKPGDRVKFVPHGN
jgi:KipI family sensor histidine kinase inhibitor